MTAKKRWVVSKTKEGLAPLFIFLFTAVTHITQNNYEFNTIYSEVGLHSFTMRGLNLAFYAILLNIILSV